MTDSDATAGITRRAALQGSSAAAVAVGAGLYSNALVQAASAQAGTEPRIQLGDDWEIDDRDDGAGNSDLALHHIPSGAELLYDASEAEWVLNQPLNANGENITGVGEFTTGERTVDKVGGRGNSTSTQSISNNTATTVELDAVDQEDDAGVLDVDTTNNRIRVKKAGWITIAASGGFNEALGDGTRAIFRFQVNGTTIAAYDNPVGANNRAAASVSDISDLAVDDDITIETFQNSGSGKNLYGDQRNSLAAIHEG